MLKNHPIFTFSLALVTTLFVIAVVIFGFDISTPKASRRALANAMANEGTSTFFYRVDDRFALAVFSDREEGQFDVSLRTYTTNYVPFCFFCGWYRDDSSDDRGILQPYRIGDLLYDVNALKEPYMGLPADSYPTYDIKTSAFAHVTDLKQIAPDAAEPKYRLRRDAISADFDEMSYSGPDDEDCQIMFAALTLAYAILLLWALAIFVRSRRRTQRA